MGEKETEREKIIDGRNQEQQNGDAVKSDELTSGHFFLFNLIFRVRKRKEHD